jgi:hypothetical protein
MAFNESSSLKAYNHYEYFLSCVPSVLADWGTNGIRGGVIVKWEHGRVGEVCEAAQESWQVDRALKRTG